MLQPQQQQQLVFPETVNGKKPDMMNPFEFEQYLGLRGPMNDAEDVNPYVSEHSQRQTSAIDKVLAGEF